MFSDIRNFISLIDYSSKIDCIQNYVPLVPKNEAPEEINYYLDPKICLILSDS
jgi:hypothetical protein